MLNFGKIKSDEIYRKKIANGLISVLSFFCIISAIIYAMKERNGSAALLMMIGVFLKINPLENFTEIAFGLQGFKVKKMLTEVEVKMEHFKKLSTAIIPIQTDILLLYYTQGNFNQDLLKKFNESIKLLNELGENIVAVSLQEQWERTVKMHYVDAIFAALKTLGKIKLNSRPNAINSLAVDEIEDYFSQQGLSNDSYVKQWLEAYKLYCKEKKSTDLSFLNFF